MSRPRSRAPSIVEAPIDGAERRPGLSRSNSISGGAHHHGHQDPKLFGPGFTSAPTHSAVDAQVKYVLVTPEMLQAIEAGHAPQTQLANNHLGRTATHGHAPNSTLSYDNKAFSEVDSEKRDIAHLPVSDDPVITGLTDVEEPYLPNPIARFRHWAKEPLGELLGTGILIIFGNGVNCQVVLSNLTQGSYLSISFGWGIGVMMGIYACGGISGAHLNPAVTVSLALFRGFPWKKVPGYALGQLIGACLGSCLIQGNYYNLVNQFEGGPGVRTFGLPTSTGALFFTATQAYMTNVSAFFSEVFATAVLLIIIMALGDSNNNPVPAGMNGHTLLWLIVGIGAALGTETAYCLNPARDLGPRIACAMFGYGKEIWTYRSGYFFWTPILAPLVGGPLGCLVYDLLVFTGKESPINRPWGKQAKQIEA